MSEKRDDNYVRVGELSPGTLLRVGVASYLSTSEVYGYGAGARVGELVTVLAVTSFTRRPETKKRLTVVGLDGVVYYKKFDIDPKTGYGLVYGLVSV